MSAEKICTTYAIQTVCVCVCVNLALCVHFECVWAYGLQESAPALNGLNTGINEKEMLFINVSDDVTLPRFYKWQFLCQLCSVQLAYSADTMCGDLKPFAYFERERCLWNYVSQKLFKVEQTSQRDYRPKVIVTDKSEHPNFIINAFSPY